MRFTTAGFLFFFVAVYLLFWTLKGRQRLYLLLVSSVIFYAGWSVAFAIHFVAMVTINYYFAHRIAATRKKSFLWTILIINFANLFFFKYFYFALKVLFDLTGSGLFTSEQFNSLLYQLTGESSITLPLAISFYTFQLTAYVVDVYRKQIENVHPFIEFYVFILFFPQLVAGPIMRHSDFFDQLSDIRPEFRKMTAGMALLQIGLIKKVVVADNLAPLINPVYASPESYDQMSNLLAGVGYTIRVYCDFSGYTDIARGLGLMLGLHLPENFLGPYFARSVRDTWRRWHITLSTWLRDYIYIPLGGSKTHPVRSYVNNLITFAAGGLWHGANYTFLVWGLLSGVFIVIERIYVHIRGRDKAPQRGTIKYKILSVTGAVYAYTVFLIGAMYFNAPDVTRGFTLMVRSFSPADGLSMQADMIFSTAVATILFHCIQFFNIKPSFSRPVTLALLFGGGLLTIWLLATFAPGSQDFIYFQF